MLDFQWPYAFLALPLPWLMRWWLPAVPRSEDAALRVPFLRDFELPASTAAPGKFRSRWPWALALLAWVALVTAATRPLWLGELVDLPVSGRDLMLAVDLSGSMQEEDFVIGNTAVDRLTATKRVAGEFIDRRVGDRIGLILFGEQAYLQAPLTFDRTTVHTLLDESVIGLAGKATAIGDAIGLAVKRLRGKKDGDRVLILLTDGANTAGAVEPLEAAELAARERLKIYTIGVGADEMLVRNFFGYRKVNPSADLDEDTLKGIAERTGGRYFRARDTGQLEEIYRLLDKLEPAAGEARQFRPKQTLYSWPLAVAAGIAAFLWLQQMRGRLP